MATGAFSVTVTVPITNAHDPDYAGRGIVSTLLAEVAQQAGVGPLTGGNLIYPPGSSTVVGTWSYTAPT